MSAERFSFFRRQLSARRTSTMTGLILSLLRLCADRIRGLKCCAGHVAAGLPQLREQISARDGQVRGAVNKYKYKVQGSLGSSGHAKRTAQSERAQDEG